MIGRAPTKAEKEWMDAARSLGCMACIVSGKIKPYSVPAEYTAIHHVDGKTKPDAHFLTIGLCPAHHQHGTDAVHVNKMAFEKKFGKQRDLVRHARILVESNS